MRKDLWWKWALIVLVIAGSVWLAFPLDQRINLGLDLQGGTHLVFEVAVEHAVENATDRLVTDVTAALVDASVPGIEVRKVARSQLVVQISEASQATAVAAALKKVPVLVRMGDRSGTALTYALEEPRVRQLEDRAVEQALETIRNRVDQFGVTEPTIQRQGTRGIVVELPGVQDPARAIQLIGQTARLEFRLVDAQHRVEKAMQGQVPAGLEVLYERHGKQATGDVTRSPLLVQQQVLLTGEALTDAEVRLGSQFHEPYVSIAFDPEGARRFERITAAHVGQRLAIVLDQTVYSAPVIQERIAGGQAQITGHFTLEEARDLAIVLRAGTLPAPVRLEESLIVGPSLGQDAIRQGLTAGLVGTLLVVGFTVVYYRLSGAVAVFALGLNTLLLLAGLAYLQATLTLPGIAGIVLSIGMAVDANVLIFERMREELRLGKSPRAAIDAGFTRAWSAILDGNVTTLIATAMLFQFGTGPIKGFAVTLSLGLLANLFTAVFVCKVVFDTIVAARPLQRLSV